MTDEPLHFPTLPMSLPGAWSWPRAPVGWEVPGSAGDGDAQPCRIETTTGVIVEASLLDMDPAAGTVSVRTSAGTRADHMYFSDMRCLRLTLPLVPAEGRAATLLERPPPDAQERDFQLEWAGAGQAPLTGRTAGHVEAGEGLYLFVLLEQGRSLQRVFVPRAAYVSCTYGRSVEEIAAERWVSDPAELLQAIERQERMPVERLGQSLIALGLITQSQLERVLASQPNDVPLGAILVTSGAISRADLQTALAHKMGYPLVNLSRFPPDPAATRMVTLRMAVESRALPLMLDGDRLIVAVDRPARTANLRDLQGLGHLKIVPVLASKGDILAALSRLSKDDIWSENVALSAGTFPPTGV